MRLLHVSDLHLSAPKGRHHGIDADASFQSVLDTCAELEDIGAVIVTGDIADDGSEAAYARARDLALTYAARRDSHVVFCLGNHDDRGAFTRVLGSGHLLPDGTDCGVPAPLDGRVSAVSKIAGIRVLTLDSLVAGRWYGRLGREQLDWLRSQLEQEAVPTVLALHHPPIDLGVEIQTRVGLADRSALSKVLSPDCVSAVLCGHFHQQIAGHVNQVPVWVTPGVFTRIDHLSGPAGTERAFAGGSATLIDITDPASPSFTLMPAIDPHAGGIAYQITLEELRADLAVYGIPCHPTSP